ncbi:C-type lectin domain family 4 member E-like isoform X1 [Melanotaenia boesemani]|uniref:C-type lectin domain family 4 member E-like isoform X1 n=1 Tax=Melanotaenia boesemani TaxID=1250792 RepID=UPI001C03C553|nr:C-type lectin domain family 4 member E-like isoform X1 [Melanotaenia boesemani]
MSEADVTYTDVQFKTTKTSAVLPSSNDTTYAEVKTFKSEPPVCVNCSQQQAGSNSERHVTSERAALLVCSVLLVAAVITLGVTAFSDFRCKEYKQLKEENEALKKNLSEQTTCPPPGLNLNEKCLKCEAGWELHGVKCYYFNTTKSSWKDSRDGCKLKGGHLVKIDSREEQKFLEARLREKMEEAEDKFWIGLRDSEEEGRWLWVDGSSLDTCLKFWNGKEPDNWKGENPDGEDCVRMGEKEGAADLKCWFDKSCNVPHKSICEKAAETR